MEMTYFLPPSWSETTRMCCLWRFGQLLRCFPN